MSAVIANGERSSPRRQVEVRPESERVAEFLTDFHRQTIKVRTAICCRRPRALSSSSNEKSPRTVPSGQDPIRQLRLGRHARTPDCHTCRPASSEPRLAQKQHARTPDGRIRPGRSGSQDGCQQRIARRTPSVLPVSSRPSSTTAELSAPQLVDDLRLFLADEFG